MSTLDARHASFVLERDFAAPVPRVFAAWANADKKRRWFACHDDWVQTDYRLDFRVGGAEHNRVVRPDGVAHVYDARLYDIVPDARIVYAYDMHVGDARISVSLVTVTFAPQDAGTRMVLTEQLVFLDGHGDREERKGGTEEQLARLEAELEVDDRVALA